MNIGGGLAALVAASMVVSCGKTPSQIDTRLVFVPFEYLGSGPDSGWAGTAVAAIAAAQVSSLLAPHVRDAQLNRARQVVQGFVTERAGNLHVIALVRDESAQKTIRRLEARGSTVLAAAAALAGQIAAQPKPYTSSNPEAVKQLYLGHPDAALALDPKFGTAHLARIETLRRSGNTEEVAKAVAAAQSANWTDLERARLQAVTAETPQARTAGLLAMARAAGHDFSYWTAAADAALLSKDTKAAIEAIQRALLLDPGSVSLWNTLAYVQAFTGNLEGAKTSLAEYRKLQPKEANAHDSLGEIHFYEGKFAEAEQHFLDAFGQNPAFLGGGDMYRAALCRFLAGDTAKADALFRRYAGWRGKQNDAQMPLREAIWLYTTGRSAEARRKAESLGTPAAKTQLAIWDLYEGKGNPAILGNRPELQGWKLLFEGRYPEAAEYWKRAYEASTVLTASEPRSLLAWALHGSGREAEAMALLQKWPLPPAGPEPGFSSLALNKTITLKAGRR